MRANGENMQMRKNDGRECLFPAREELQSGPNTINVHSTLIWRLTRANHDRWSETKANAKPFQSWEPGVAWDNQFCRTTLVLCCVFFGALAFGADDPEIQTIDAPG